jgi:hypothetical protein
MDWQRFCELALDLPRVTEGSWGDGDYGVPSIPYAFVIGRDGKLVWAGHPAREEVDGAVLDALKAK